MTRTAALVKFATPLLFIQQEDLHPARRLHDSALADLSMRKEQQHLSAAVYAIRSTWSRGRGKGQLKR